MKDVQADIETAVIGAGVIGLAIAAELAQRGQAVMVLERNGGIGQETSSRSSEVIHAGIYYPKGSLRAQLCVGGRDLLYNFADQHGVPVRRTGKLIVANSEAELSKLQSIKSAALGNGVDDITLLTEADVAAIEPDVKCRAALLSPSTGIVDSHGLMKALEGILDAHAGAVVFHTKVLGIERTAKGLFALDIVSAGEATRVTAKTLVVSAGLGMASLRDRLPRAGDYTPPCCHFAKGHYFVLSGRTPFRHLVYPVPVEGGLGTHLTLDLQGRARFGPDVHWIAEPNYTFDDSNGALKIEFETSIRRYWPGLPVGALEPGYVGVRPKISAQGEPSCDFKIHGPLDHGVPKMIALYGMESPGLTSSLAIARYTSTLLGLS